MATPADYRNVIDRVLALDPARQLLQLNSSKIEKLFEVYVLALMLDAVDKAGGRYEIHGASSGLNPATVVFRAAPGSMYSTTQDFSFVRCVLNSKVFELHVDVEYEGASTATHEMDVSIIEETNASRARQSSRNPKYPVLIAECKFYSGSVSIGLARALVGLVSDFHMKVGGLMVTNNASDNLKHFLSKRNRPDPCTDLTPTDKAIEQRFIVNVESKLRKWASV